MIHTLLKCLDVAVQHRRVRADSLFMDRASNFKPSRTRNLVACNQRPRTLGKNLRASARAASHSRVVKLIDHPLQRLTCNFCEEVELDHRKCLQVNGWKSFLQSAK